MAIVPTQGEIYYNGYTFPVETRTTDVSCVPTYDSAGRTVVYTVYTFTIEAKIIAVAGGENNTLTLPQIRLLLEQPGGAFRYTGKGLGDISVNGAAAASDVLWGPKPRVLRWRPIGGNKAANVTWTVEVAFPECTSASYRYNLMEFCYSIQYRIDRAGYTTRTYTGHIRIPQTRTGAGARNLTDTADLYWERVAADVPLGFRKVSADRTVSEDKCRLDFTIVHEEMVNPLPEGVIDVQASHRQQNLQPLQLVWWGGQISAQYEMAKNYPRTVAYQHFWNLVQDRIGAVLAQNPPGVLVIPQFITMEEPEIHGRRSASFSFTYRVTVPGGKILTDGLWRPVPFTDYALWKRSLSRTANAPRGNVGMVTLPADDVILDLCTRQQPNTMRSMRTTRDTTGPLRRSMTTGCPAPENSWLEYETDVSVVGDSETIEHKPLPTRSMTSKPLGSGNNGTTTSMVATDGNGIRADVRPGSGGLAGGIVGGFGGAIGGAGVGSQTGTAGGSLVDLFFINYLRQLWGLMGQNQKPAAPAAPQPSTAPDRSTAVGTINNRVNQQQIPESVFQQRVSPTVEIVVKGHAKRVCYEIPVPSLLSYAGYELVPANDQKKGDFFRTGLEGNVGVPIYWAEWQQRYRIVYKRTQTSQPVGAPPNALVSSQTGQVSGGDPSIPGGGLNGWPSVGGVSVGGSGR